MIQYPLPFVIEHGVGSAIDLTEYWMPAFAGMTTEGVALRFR